jgi:hypothetical protein
MTVRMLPMRRIVIPACWPFSGSNYEVWEGNKCVLCTNSLAEAEAKAGEV